MIISGGTDEENARRGGLWSWERHGANPVGLAGAFGERQETYKGSEKEIYEKQGHKPVQVEGAK